MSFDYSLPRSINLHFPGRISREDAERQRHTAATILQRLAEQPGVVLADEVGMGKTFVALAVASAVALGRRRAPVVIMVPPGVREKWRDDVSFFVEHCMAAEDAARLRCAVADNGVELMRRIDDPSDRRASIIILAHGAMSLRLGDAWIKLALIQASTRYKRGADALKRALAKFAARLLRLEHIEAQSPGSMETLLTSPPSLWGDRLRQRGITFADENGVTDDNPVPDAILDILFEIDTSEVFKALEGIPRYETASLKSRLSEVRRAVDAAVREVWVECLHRARYSLPLLILDEAHHLKNPQTRLASLFETPEATGDADEVSRGALAGVFDRMLFLTATPFQLGHQELCNVLDRFGGIAWKGRAAPAVGRDGYAQTLKGLRQTLDAAELAALELDTMWSRLSPEDMRVDGTRFSDAAAWWAAVNTGEQISAPVAIVRNLAHQAKTKLQEAEAALRPWVVRHTRPAHLPAPFPDVRRRRRLPGAAVLSGEDADERACSAGLELAGDAMLPFLLAARVVSITPESRPVFSEGLASSYEAFLETRAMRTETAAGAFLVDEDQSDSAQVHADPTTTWYLDQIKTAIDAGGSLRSGSHPKIRATTDLAMRLWTAGEKVLIFCHYIATGRALRAHLSSLMRAKVAEEAARRLSCPVDRVDSELDRLAARFDKGNPAARACAERVDALLTGFPELEGKRDLLHDIVLRFVRTPTFLLRYAGIESAAGTRDLLGLAFDRSDGQGLSFAEQLKGFFEFLELRCSEMQRTGYLEALNKIQTGSHHGRDALSGFDDDERAGLGTETLISNVRLVNGATRAETRQRLMRAFNTPFYPEILVASSVMAEGVDLHLNCRHVIHHDLSWNPSTLEQRTGRVDRIGAKAEQVGRSIAVYLPYVGGTQDEKMYRVVTDREQWFNIVMGGSRTDGSLTSARETDKYAERIPLPAALRDELTIRLAVWPGTGERGEEGPPEALAA